MAGAATSGRPWSCPAPPFAVTDFERTARTTADHLDAVGAAYALVGGFAVLVRCDPRFTRDIDLVVAVTGDEEAEAVVRTLVAALDDLVSWR